MSEQDPHGTGRGSFFDRTDPADHVDPVDPVAAERTGHTELDEPVGAPATGTPAGGRRRSSRGPRVSGWLPVLVVVALLVVGGLVFVPRAIDKLHDTLNGGPADYPGPGSGRVVFTVAAGDTLAETGRKLESAGVVKSVEAFTQAADKATGSIQPGVFVLKKEMAAATVVSTLSNAKNDRALNLTLLAGKSVDEIVALLAKNTRFKASAYDKVLANPSGLGLPSYADGSAEGYLYPGRYTFGPDDTPTTILKAMVDGWRTEAKKTDLEAKAQALGYTPQQLMTVASILQAEGRQDDQAKVARVIYNRLEIDGNPSAGFLQVDATVNYALGEPDIARLTQAQIDSVASSPYNTYTHQGLPPGPIEQPSGGAIEAALNPADGDWIYYVTVNLRTGLTKFTSSPTQFAEYKSELDQYCATQSDRC